MLQVLQWSSKVWHRKQHNVLTRDLPSIILSKCPLVVFFSVSYKESSQKQLVKLFLFVKYNKPPSMLVYNTDDTKNMGSICKRLQMLPIINRVLRKPWKCVDRSGAVSQESELRKVVQKRPQSLCQASQCRVGYTGTIYGNNYGIIKSFLKIVRISWQRRFNMLNSSHKI